MAEPIGLCASVISIWDLVKDIKNFSTKISGASEQWQRYCNDLETLAHVQSVLKEITDGSSRIRNITIEVNGQRQGLVEFANERLCRVRGEADVILTKYYQPAPSKSSRMWKWFSRTRDSLSFALEEEHIEDLRKAVEYAKSSLHSAICLAHMAGSDSWQQQTGILLDDIKDHMVKQSMALEKIHETSKLDRRPFKICVQSRPLPLRPTSKASFRNFRTFKQRRKRLAFSDDAKNIQAFDSDGMLIRNRAPTRTPIEPGPSCQWAELEIIEPAPDDDYGDMDDAVDDDTDDDASAIQDQAINKAVGKRPSDTPEENDYDFICRGGELLMVATDSDEYKMATSSGNNFGLHNPSMIMRATDVTQPMTDEEWEKCVQSEPEDFMDFLTTASCTAACSDAELNYDESPINITLRQQSDVFISKAIKLAKCNAVGTENLFFCVDRLSIIDNGQVFCLLEPCASRNRCKHITIEGLDGERIRRNLPCRFSLAFIDYKESLKSEPEVESEQPSYISAYSGKCKGRRPCRHTLVEDRYPTNVKCALPAQFCASFGGDVSDMSELDSGTERGLSDRDDNRHDQVNHKRSSCDNQTKKCSNERSQEPKHNAELPLYPSPEDEYSFSILRDVMLKRSSGIPEKVDLGTFIHFMLLVQKYDLGDIPLEQAKIWVQFLLPSVPKFYNEEAITWLWVFCKLHMNSEFKNLSAIVQREVQRPIKNKDPFLLPRYIIDRIEERRLSVLSRVKSLVNSEISSRKEAYLKAINNSLELPDWAIPIEAMRHSAVVGYLTLESERWLNRGEDPDLEFDGVSFSDICNCVRSMIDLGDWMIRTVPPSENMPRFLADLSVIVPILGVGLHNPGLSGGLSGISNKRLVDLVSSLEKEDWGIDLASST